MPEVGSEDDSTVTLESPEGDLVGELFLSSEVIKSGDFNPEDHVILVVPESSEHLVTDGENSTSFVIPTSEDGEGLDVDPDRLRETIKSNFLVITKLLPTKPAPLVPIVTSKLSGEEVKVLPGESSGTLLPNQLPSTTPAAPKPAKNKHLRSPRSPGSRNHTIKQELPEIFGKMFPASYNEVMYKQIREIIFFKCGKDTTEDTEVFEGINCPHCRKKPVSLNLLKEHLANCHTYSAKRKNSSPSKTITKKTLFRCQYCGEAFISSGQKPSHECSPTVKPLAHATDAIESITCSICQQDFCSPSELKCHQELSHPDDGVDDGVSQTNSNPNLVPASENIPEPLPKPHVLGSFCDERVSSSQKEPRDIKTELGSTNPLECVKCHKPAEDVNQEKICSTCHSSCQETKLSGSELTAASRICPACDLEVDAAMFADHVDSHRNDSAADTVQTVRILTCSTCQEEFKSDSSTSDQCKRCQIV